MGRSGDPYATDTLERLLPHATPSRNRERDALLCCGESIAASLLAAELNSMGIPSISLRETQLGLSTNDSFGDAEIVTADPTWIVKYLKRDYVVVAAGFQGVGSDVSLRYMAGAHRSFAGEGWRFRRPENSPKSSNGCGSRFRLPLPIQIQQRNM